MARRRTKDRVTPGWRGLASRVSCRENRTSRLPRPQGGAHIRRVDRPIWAAKRANLRSGTGTQYDEVGLLEIGERVRVTDETGRMAAGPAFERPPLLAAQPPAAEDDLSRSCMYEVCGESVPTLPPRKGDP